MKLAPWLALAALVGVLAGCGSSRHYTASEVRQAFTQAGLRKPRVESSSTGVILNYGQRPHLVSVTILSGDNASVQYVTGQPKGIQITRQHNVTVYYDDGESGVVTRALDTLK